MSKLHGRRRNSRSLTYEACEVRFVMSADLLADLHVELLRDDFASGGSARTLGVNDLTGLTQARADYGFDGRGQTVVVIDTGIAYDHTALGAGLGTGHRVVGGWDFAERDANPYDDGPYGSHGTHVAGIIGSSDSRALGLSPGVDLVALRVFDDAGNGNFAMIEQALQWVYQNRNQFANPITTVNLSIGSGWNSSSVPSWTTLEDDFSRLESVGIFTAVAAGNDFQSVRTVGLDYPAASRFVVPVSSVDADGRLSSFSQRLDRVIAAPGRSIRSTVPDYVGNRDGRANDFASYSGTSMASPYVAGASVLLRQAMQFVGYAAISQDSIYDLMRRTADSVFDSLTNQNYLRLNIDKALDALMPSDDYGSSAGSARDLGRLSGSQRTSGVITSRSDRDYFTFRADVSGTVTLRADAREWLDPRFELIGTSGTTSNNGRTMTFSVVAGQSYTLGLSTAAGLGHYDLDWQVTAAAPRAPIQWGVFKYEVRSDVRLDGPLQVFTLRADSTGWMSVEARFAQSGGNVDFEIYNANGQRLATGHGGDGWERIDALVQQGETVSLHVIGANRDVDFRLMNQLTISNGLARIHGGDGADSVDLRITSSGYELTINGLRYDLARSEFALLQFEGQGGHDTLLVGTDRGDDLATLRDGGLLLVGESYRIEGTRLETIELTSGGGADRAIVFGSDRDDTLTARPGLTELSNGATTFRLRGFRDVTIDLLAGQDTVTLGDTAGDDTLILRQGESQIRGTDYHVLVRGLEVLRAMSAGGFDRVELYDSRGDDSLRVDGSQVRHSSLTHDYLLTGFEQFRAMFSSGNDRGYFYDSAGNDRVEARGNYLHWSTPLVDLALYDLDLARAYADRGGDDRANVEATDYLFFLTGNWS